MRTPIVLFVLAALVRGGLVLAYPDPAYPDSYYYVNVAQQLLAGHGFSIDFIWVFADVGGTLPANPVLPIPSNAHWMPLAALIQVPFLTLLGNSPVIALLPFILVGSLTAPLTWALAREVGAPRSVQLGAGILGAIPAASTVFFGQPDNFALYQPLGMAALWMAARGLKGDARAFAFGGLLVGLATLARNDGILLGVTLGLTFMWDRWKTWRSGGARVPRIPAWAAVGCLALFALVMAPWYARQLAEFGSISPSSSSGRILWVRTFEEMNSVTAPATLSTFLGQGFGPLVQSRLLGLAAAIGNFIVICCSVFLAPFLVIGAWRRRRSVDFGPYFLYAALLFGANGLLFAVHVPYGTFLHSAVALEPGAYILALEGVVAAVVWIAARRKTWNVAQAVPVFVGSAVALAVVTAVLGAVAVQAGWNVEREQRRQIAAELDRLGVAETDRLMTIDAGGFKYYTGRGGVVTVNDPIGTIEQVARAYGIRWLVVERAHTVPALAAVLKGESHPDWIGQPALVIPRTGGASAATPTDPVPAVVLYPVCLTPADDRCATTAGLAPTGATP